MLANIVLCKLAVGMVPYKSVKSDYEIQILILRYLQSKLVVGVVDHVLEAG